MALDKPKVRLFYALNGYDSIRRVHKIFYDRVYAHPWLGQFFKGHDQSFIEEQQTRFMAEKFGGPREYMGKEPKYAHEHMYISDELFDLRQSLLRRSLIEACIPSDLIEQWLAIDGAFRKQVANESLAGFLALHTFKQRVVVEKPQ